MNHDRSLATAALKGAAAGVLGGMAMMAAMMMEEKALLPEGSNAKPPPMKVVAKGADVAGVQLSDSELKAAGMTAHLGYSALWGALLGVSREELPLSPGLQGLLLAAVAYGVDFPSFGLLPQLGIERPPSQQSMEKAAIAPPAHLLFGLTTAAAYELMN
ncbi:MAG TPA: hypothetical protein VFI96_01895 [Longimicrobiaceae bacterium]|nr:hypothetical protein [Longimicrobiaceae bacterium]